MTTAAVPEPSSVTFPRVARAAVGVVAGWLAYLALVPWLPSIEAWASGHLVALVPGVREAVTSGPRFSLVRGDGTLADLIVSPACSWSGGIGVLAGVAVATGRGVRSGLKAVVVPGLVFGVANLMRIVAVGVVLVVWRGDHVWTVHSLVGSAITGLCGVLAVAWCVRLGHGGREHPRPAGVA